MTRFEYLRNNLTQRQLAKYLAEFTSCEHCECYDLCSKTSHLTVDQGYIDCEDVIYMYLNTEQINV
jgi:hypothetical protein